MNINLTQDFFALFGLKPQFKVDAAALDRAYHDLQSTVHPDRFAHLPETERRLSMQAATRVNEGYRTLRKPLTRAQYLLELKGIDVKHQSNTSMPTDFLMEQMEWREAVAEARAAEDAAELAALHTRLKKQGNEMARALERSFDQDNNADMAADLTRRLMFIEKLQHDIDEALEALES